MYNCGGYENPEFLKQMDGLVDIYMPDVKYGSDAAGESYSGVKNYTKYCRNSLREMHSQVGVLTMNRFGVAEKGLLVRHLVLPNNESNSEAFIDFITDSISPNTYINIMGQYRPLYRADSHPEIARRVYRQEVMEVKNYAKNKGMNNLIA